ncbi:MAG: hypothetical protein WCJ39_00540 [bacterium]
MNKPELKEMNNWKALQEGFHDIWKTKFIVPQDLDLIGLKDICSG